MTNCGIQTCPSDRISRIRFIGEKLTFKVKIKSGGTTSNNDIKLFKRIPNQTTDKQIGATLTGIPLNTEKTINYIISREDAGPLDPSAGITTYKVEASYLCPTDNKIKSCITDGCRSTILILKSIDLSAIKTSIKIGETLQIKILSKDVFGNFVYDKPILSWLSSNSTLAIVSSTGLVTGKSAGNVRITGKFVFGSTTVSNYIDIVVTA